MYASLLLTTALASLAVARPQYDVSSLEKEAYQFEVEPVSDLPLANCSCVDGPRVNYTVVSGDTIGAIAKTFLSGICNITAASNVTDPDYINVGQVLVVPVAACNPDSTSCLHTSTTTTSTSATCVKNGTPTYTIKSGDTLYDVSQSLGITLAALEAANPTVKPETLAVGQVINVPVC